MKINEIFYSIQGEGKTVGQPAFFLRLAGCNLRCCFCDSFYTWSEYEDISIDKVFSRIKLYNHLVITGGEPLLQQSELEKLLQQYEGFVEIETNGTIEASDSLLSRVDLWNISPKTSYSQTYEIDTTPVLLTQINDMKDYIVKFVVDGDKDKVFIEDIREKYDINKSRIYIMPQSATRKKFIEKSDDLVDYCKFKGYNFSPRLQLIIWDNKRGV